MDAAVPAGQTSDTATATGSIIVQPKLLERHGCTTISRSWIHSTPHNSVAWVHVSYQIAADGAVKDIVVSSSSGDAGLDAITVSCVQKWRYTPGTKDGQPVDMPWQANLRYWHQ
jgi:TonB family protein